MEVNIDEVSSTVQAVDDESLVNPQVMRKILSAVLQAVDDKQAHADRVRQEQDVSAGVSEEQHEAWR